MKKFMRLSLFFLLCFSPPKLGGLVILIHGSLATQETWHKPEGDFFKALYAKAIQTKHEVVSFQWSGIPTSYEITRAGKNLALFIAGYPQQEDLVLVGHSHGGNVINKATDLLSDFMQQIVLTESPDILLDATFTSRLRTVSLVLKQKRSSLIKRIYLLGTPIDLKNFAPDMRVVEHVCLLYSDSDMIQSVFGTYKKTLKKHPRQVNLRVTINKKSPGHSELHDPLIGTWLLDIPEKLSGFNEFAWGVNGEVNFQKQQLPLYMVSRLFENEDEILID